ncbi:CMRF35-like molecule 4 isoform X2 [Denticeps clupeoides]|uniref:CMRF35-like molecule 4 isoform X2 n=1 Tax=Denticeps clupeoides TaxID=299321 RepID=UPI0010A41C6E|nr:CMRF35-like molecule 4 isoform X2 [Denticeps clupeoides]
MRGSLLILCSLLSGVDPEWSVTAPAGGTAEIRCSYDAGYEGKRKYLCRGECSYGNKDIPIQTEGGQARAEKERYLLYDNATARVFTVTIRNLTPADSGKYWCAVRTHIAAPDIYSQGQLPATSEAQLFTETATFFTSSISARSSELLPQSARPQTANQTSWTEEPRGETAHLSTLPELLIYWALGLTVLAAVFGSTLAVLLKRKRRPKRKWVSSAGQHVQNNEDTSHPAVPQPQEGHRYGEPGGREGPPESPARVPPLLSVYTTIGAKLHHGSSDIYANVNHKVENR